MGGAYRLWQKEGIVKKLIEINLEQSVCEEEEAGDDDDDQTLTQHSRSHNPNKLFSPNFLVIFRGCEKSSGSWTSRPFARSSFLTFL